jgi:hypothetical protein
MRQITLMLILTLATQIGQPVQAYQTETNTQGITLEAKRLAQVRRERVRDQEARVILEQEEATESIGVPLGEVPKIIYSVFGAYGAKAVEVASCESGLNTSATNGQYLGLFQMGEMERAIYGGSSMDPWDQTRAAYAYFLASGSDWSPWSAGVCA